jgi:hypothetical protein
VTLMVPKRWRVRRRTGIRNVIDVRDHVHGEVEGHVGLDEPELGGEPMVKKPRAGSILWNLVRVDWQEWVYPALTRATWNSPKLMPSSVTAQSWRFAHRRSS